MSTDSPLHTHAPGHSHDHEQAGTHGPSHAVPPAHLHARPIRSVLAWPAWLRVLAVLPMVVVIWLAVLWANEGVALW